MPKEYLTQDEIEAMERAANCERDKLLVHLLCRLGCRVTEELGIAVDDIDFASATVVITHLKARVVIVCGQCGAKLGLRHEYCPECGAKSELNATQRSERRKQRILPIDQKTLAMIKSFVDNRGPVMRDGKLHLFSINRHRAWQIVRECAARAGLPILVNPETGKPRGVSPHRLRDAFAVHAMKVDDSGEGMRMLQEHLGHSSFNTTARYRKIASEEHRTWYERLWKETRNSDTALEK